jgi:hypothetical protein
MGGTLNHRTLAGAFLEAPLKEITIINITWTVIANMTIARTEQTHVPQLVVATYISGSFAAEVP